MSRPAARPVARRNAMRQAPPHAYRSSSRPGDLSAQRAHCTLSRLGPTEVVAASRPAPAVVRVNVIKYVGSRVADAPSRPYVGDLYFMGQTNGPSNGPYSAEDDGLLNAGGPKSSFAWPPEIPLICGIRACVPARATQRLLKVTE